MLKKTKPNAWYGTLPDCMIRTIFKDRRLRHRHIRSFKMSIVVRVGGTKEFAEVHEVEVEDGKVED